MTKCKEDHMAECKIYFYYEDELDDCSKQLVRRAIAYWSESLGGTEPEVHMTLVNSWGEILTFWLPRTVATAIIGWTVKQLLTKGFCSRRSQLSDSSDSESRPAESTLLATPADDAVSTRRQTDDMPRPEPAHLNELVDTLPKKPGRITFLLRGHGPDQESRLVSQDSETRNTVIAEGRNEDIERMAYDLTFGRWRAKDD